MRSFTNDKRGSMLVAVLAITLLPITFAVWLISWTPIAQTIDILSAATTNENAQNVFGLINNVAAWLLLLEVAGLIVWWFVSSFRREDQTYPRGAGYG